jgi:serine/threonine protein kinase
MTSTVWRTKLDDAELACEKLMERHVKLKGDFAQLSDKYASTKACVLDTVWRYIPQHCNMFYCIPALDPDLTESAMKVGEWSIGETLGSGQFSVVKKCTHLDEPNKAYAIKMVCKDKYRTVDSLHRAENEIKALSMLGKHDNLMTAKFTLHGRAGLYIVTDIMPWDLFDFTDKFSSSFDDKLAGFILSSLLAGIGHIWKNGLIHRDLKPENILVNFHKEQLSIKIADFGLSTEFHEGDTLKDFCGSPGFYAPEVTTHSEYCGRQADLYSIGCIMMEIMMGQSFFRDVWLAAYRLVKSTSPKSFRGAIRMAIDSARKTLTASYPADISKSIGGMISYESSMRPDIQSLQIRNNWIAEGQSEANSQRIAISLNARQRDELKRIPRGLAAARDKDSNNLPPSKKTSKFPKL